MTAQPSPELTAKGHPKPSSLGHVLAVIGAWLQLAPVAGFVMTAVSMIRAYQIIGESGPNDSAALSAPIGDALTVTMLGIVLMLPGAAMLFLAVFGCGYRSSWLFGLFVILGVCYLPMFPYGTFVGLAFLGTALAKRKEFLAPSNPIMDIHKPTQTMNESVAGSWYTMGAGATLGTIGSEGGTILRDEEHAAGARITLEKDGHTPYGITCGIYGCFVHTAFASSEVQAVEMYERMKGRLEELILSDGNIEDEVEAFVNQF